MVWTRDHEFDGIIEVSDIIAKHYLEPCMADVFVEGERDEGFFEWIFSESGEVDKRVYPIRRVNISKTLITKHGLKLSSRRDQVIALSYEISNELPPDSRVKCLIDRDYENYLPKVKHNNFLRLTDYNSIECYFMSENVLRKWIEIVLVDKPTSITKFYYDMKEILMRIFTFRLANESLAWQMRLKIDGCVELEDMKINFKWEKFVTCNLRKNGRLKDKGIFRSEAQKFRKILNPDVRLSIRGKDLTELLYICDSKRKRGKKAFRNSDAISGSLFLCGDCNTLKEESVLHEIIDF